MLMPYRPVASDCADRSTATKIVFQESAPVSAASSVIWAFVVYLLGANFLGFTVGSAAKSHSPFLARVCPSLAP